MIVQCYNNLLHTVNEREMSYHYINIPHMPLLLVTTYHNNHSSDKGGNEKENMKAMISFNDQNKIKNEFP